MPFQRFDDPFANHMVGQASKGLNADDIGHAMRDELHHLSGKEPPFSILVSQGQKRLCHLGNLIDGNGGLKPPALSERFYRRFSQSFDHFNRRLGEHSRGFFAPRYSALYCRPYTL